MLILGIESASRVASVGLVRAAVTPDEARHSPPGQVADGCVMVAEVSRDTALAHGAELIVVIEECLGRAGAALDAVRCIAVGIGPGPFTGLRVALATAKGLVLGTDVALVGVSTLEALAATVLPEWSPDGAPPDVAIGSLVASCLDARKGEVYGAVFRVRAPVAEEPSPRLERLSLDAALRPADFARTLGEHLERQGSGAPPPFILGDGAERHVLEGVVRDLEAESFVRMPGRLRDDELVDLYRRAWVLTSASAAEGWGMTITEAAACGTPAVVTDISGHRDAVRHGVTGLLADERELGPAIGRVLTDEGLRARLGSGALAHARTFTWEATATGTLSALAVEAHRLRLGRPGRVR